MDITNDPANLLCIFLSAINSFNYIIMSALEDVLTGKINEYEEGFNVMRINIHKQYSTITYTLPDPEESSEYETVELKNLAKEFLRERNIFLKDPKNYIPPKGVEITYDQQK